MLIPVLDEAFDGEEHVDDPALHGGRHVGVGSPLEAKVSEAPEPKAHHALLVPVGKVSVAFVGCAPPFLLLRIVQLVATG